MAIIYSRHKGFSLVSRNAWYRFYVLPTSTVLYVIKNS